MNIERLGPYRIVGSIGRGGMGVVYEGVHCDTGEPAAVKLLSAVMAQEEGFRLRFESEIETLRKLNHPNIVRLFGFGEQDGHLFYAMELVRGNSLEAELRRGRRFDWREVARIGVEICRALRHAHDRGIVHRDIKPANLLLADDGRVKLSDFGIARLFGNTRLTAAGNVVGTAEYMSPEQAEGRAADARSDLYSLGAVLYTLLAQRPVFRGKSLVDVLQKQRFEQPEPVRKHAADVPEEFEQILQQLLEKDPARRIPNADLLGRRVEAMIRALSVCPETLEADASWFAFDRKTADTPVLQQTEEFTASGGQRPSQPDDSTVDTAPEQPAAKTEPGRFVPVAEDELDQAETDQSRPAMISLHTWALAAALLLAGLSVWWFLQPPTADALHEKITAALAEGSTASLMQAKNDIAQFTSRYPDDSRAPRLAGMEQEIDLQLLERKFERQKNFTQSEKLSPIERFYLEAIADSRFHPERAMAKLQAIVDMFNQPGDQAGSVGQCLELARRRLARLSQESQRLAADQITALQDRLRAADELLATDPEQAKAIYRAIIELYGDKPWAAEVVADARKALERKP